MTSAAHITQKGKTVGLTPQTQLAEVFAQHEGLRAIMDRCEDLADQLDAGKGDVLALIGEVARLRIAFDEHNKFEEQVLRSVLREIAAFGDVRIERMFDDHVGEHRAMHLQLGDATTNALRGAIDGLRTHLAAEERHFRKVM